MLASYAGKKGIGFPLLSDRDLEVTKRFGIVNDSSGRVPHPTAAVVDGQGIVRWLRVDPDFRKRPSADEILAVLDGLVKAHGAPAGPSGQ